MSDEVVHTPPQWPRGAGRPEGGDMVSVLMTEDMARAFERRCLGNNTRGDTYLCGPLLFSEDDVPTYIIGVNP